jgi:hypothetical protein
MALLVSRRKNVTQTMSYCGSGLAAFGAASSLLD